MISKTSTIEAGRFNGRSFLRWMLAAPSAAQVQPQTAYPRS